MSFIGSIANYFSSQSSTSQSSPKTKSPQRLPFSFLCPIDPSFNLKGWITDLDSHITILNQKNINTKTFKELLITIGRLLNTHMRQTRTCRGLPARVVSDKIQDLIVALVKNDLAEVEKRAFVNNPAVVPLSIKLMRLAQKVVPLTNKRCDWDWMPVAIKIKILAQGLYDRKWDNQNVPLEIIRNEIIVNRIGGDNLLLQYIREFNCSDLEEIALNTEELDTLVTGMNVTGLENRISLRGLGKDSVTWRLYRKYVERYPSSGWSLLMNMMNNDNRKPSLALLTKEERNDLVRAPNSIRQLGLAKGHYYVSYKEEVPHILSFLREAVAHNFGEGYALWARTMANSSVSWDIWDVDLNVFRTQLTQAEIEGIVDNIDSISLIEQPGYYSKMTWEAIFRTAFNKGLSGHLESWRQIARLINYRIPESSSDERGHNWISSNWNILFPWSVTGLSFEDLPLEFRLLITHLDLSLNRSNSDHISRMIESFPNLTVLRICGTHSEERFILPENCKNLEILMLEKLSTALEDTPNLRILKLRDCENIVFSSSQYDRLEVFEALSVNFEKPEGPLLMPVAKTINLHNCKISELPFAPCLTQLELREIPIKDIGAEKTNLQRLRLEDCFGISNFPHSLKRLTELYIEERDYSEIIIKPLSLPLELLIQLLPGKNYLLPFNIIKNNALLWLRIFHAWVIKTESLEALKEGLKTIDLFPTSEDLFDLLKIDYIFTFDPVNILAWVNDVELIFQKLPEYSQWYDSFSICSEKIRKYSDSGVHVGSQPLESFG